MTATGHWLTDAERGTSFSIRLIIGLTRVFGRPVGRFFLYPTTAYFWLLSGRRKAASAAYLSVVLGRPAGARETFAHYLCFARVLLDRALLLMGRGAPLAIRVQNGSLVHEALAEGRGCILLGAHFGSYDVLRQVAQLARLDIKILMRVEATQTFNAIMAALNPDWHKQVIPLGHIDTILRAQEHLRAGGLLGLLGDRTAPQERTVPATFFGRPAAFAAGPHMLARALDAPIIAFFGAYLGDDRYEVWFERIDLLGATAAERTQAGAAAFATHLEAACRRAPYNWFNFYDFWEPGAPPP